MFHDTHVACLNPESSLHYHVRVHVAPSLLGTCSQEFITLQNTCTLLDNFVESRY